MIQFLKSAYKKDQLLDLEKKPTVLFLGRSNAGKSTLLNALTKKNLAKISKQPGKTRSINYFSFKVAAKNIQLVDLPGYGYAKRSKKERQEWGDLVRDFFEGLASPALALILMDAKRDWEAEEWDLALSLIEHGHRVHGLFTKSDRVPKKDRFLRESQFEQHLELRKLKNLLTYQWISAIKGEGLKGLYKKIEDYVQNFSQASSHA